MRVDLRRCDRCHGDYDANLVNAWEIKTPEMRPIDLCMHCTGLVASVIHELAPVTNQGDGAHLWSMVTKDHVDSRLEGMAEYVNFHRRSVDDRLDEEAAKPLIIP